MKRLKLFLSILLLFSCGLLSVAQNYYSTPYSEYRDGKPYQYYENDQIRILASASVMKYLTYNPKELVISFEISSKGGRYDLNPANVHITAIQKNGTKRPWPSFTFADYQKRTRNNFYWWGAKTGNSTSTKSTNISVKDKHGKTQKQITETQTRTYHDDSMPTLTEQTDSYVAENLTRYFRRTTLAPELPFYGDLICQYSKKNVEIQIEFRIGNDTYEFYFEATE